MNLLDLPNELLQMIKEHIDPRDLLAHVCYLRLCPRTHACYALNATPPGFWRKLLHANGLGLPLVEFEGERQYKLVGIECAMHAWSCPDPACGMARLEENRALVQEAERDWPKWGLGKTVTPQQASDRVRGQIKTSTLFSRLSFNDNFPWTRASDGERSARMNKCAFIRQEAPGWSSTDLLANHPIARRSFATFPALTEMRMLDVDESRWDLHAANATGITVHDILLRLSEILDDEMSCDLLQELLEHVLGVPGDRDDIFPKSWTHRDVLSAAQKVGSWFQLTNFDGPIIEDSSSDGPWFIMYFSYKDLPEKAGEHIAMYKRGRQS